MYIIIEDTSNEDPAVRRTPSLGILPTLRNPSVRSEEPQSSSWFLPRVWCWEGWPELVDEDLISTTLEIDRERSDRVDGSLLSTMRDSAEESARRAGRTLKTGLSSTVERNEVDEIRCRTNGNLHSDKESSERIHPVAWLWSWPGSV